MKTKSLQRALRLALIILLVGATLVAQPLSAYATVTQDDVDEQQDKLNDVNREINHKKAELAEVQEQQKQTAAEITSIEEDLTAKQAELEKVEADLAATQAELEDTKAKLADAIARCEKQKQEMADRVRAVYMQYESAYASYLNIIFSSENISDFLSRLNMVRSMLNEDNDTLDSYKAHQQEVEDYKAQLEEQEAKIAELKAQVEQQKADIEQKKKEHEQALAQLEDQEEYYQDELDQLEKDSKALEDLIQQLIAQLEEGKYAGGQMAWPVPGHYRITSSFGYRTHPVTGVKKLHTGIDIGSNPGEPINGKKAQAAAAGTVILAQYYGGYGNCVIISHGSGIVTLYGHGSAILVNVGDKVKRGQAVLKIGSTGVSTGPHLHFEVRENGTPVDPMKYLQ